MNTEEQARKLMAQERQHDDHVHENMRERAAVAEAISETEERARERLAQERQHDEHIQANMLERTSQEVK